VFVSTVLWGFDSLYLKMIILFRCLKREKDKEMGMRSQAPVLTLFTAFPLRFKTVNPYPGNISIMIFLRA